MLPPHNRGHLSCKAIFLLQKGWPYKRLHFFSNLVLVSIRPAFPTLYVMVFFCVQWFVVFILVELLIISLKFFFFTIAKNIHFCTYTSWVRKRNSSDRNKYVINNTLEIDIHAPVNVGCVRSFGTLRYMSNL